jgi:hypothetical protein
MTLRTNASIARLKSIAESSFTDSCVIYTPTVTALSLGKQTKTWATSSNVACGFNPSNAMKTYRGEVITFDCDALLRLPLTTAMDTTKEVSCRGQRYRVSGITQGKTVNIIQLKRCDPNEQP